MRWFERALIILGFTPQETMGWFLCWELGSVKVFVDDRVIVLDNGEYILGGHGMHEPRFLEAIRTVENLVMEHFFDEVF